MNSLINLSHISVAKVVKLEQVQRSLSPDKNAGLEQEMDYEFVSNFADGELDGENNFEPIAYQWFSSDYRQGYLSGVAKRIDAQHFNTEEKYCVQLS